MDLANEIQTYNIIGVVDELENISRSTVYLTSLSRFKELTLKLQSHPAGLAISFSIIEIHRLHFFNSPLLKLAYHQRQFIHNYDILNLKHRQELRHFRNHG